MTYSSLLSPDERDERIFELRRLHGLMDGAVLRAYGWDDLAESARCEFLLDYEEEGELEIGDSELGTGGSSQSLTPSLKSRRKLPWRYRWPDDFRDEVLARLLELNEKRYKQEQLAGAIAYKGKEAKKSKLLGTRRRRIARKLKCFELSGGHVNHEPDGCVLALL